MESRETEPTAAADQTRPGVKERSLPPLEVSLAAPWVPETDPALLEVPEPLLEALSEARRIAVAVHVQPPPDGDGVGSALGLTRALRAFGKEARLCVDDELPGFLRALDAHAEARRARELLGERFDLVVLVDVADPVRTGGGARLVERAPAVAVVDHHQIVRLDRSSLCLAPGARLLSWLDPGFDATCLQVAGIVARLDRAHPLTPGQWATVALPLAVGTFTDTGGFGRPGVEPISLSIFKHLLSHHLDDGLEAVREALRWELPSLALALLQDPPTLPEELQDEASLAVLAEVRGLLAAGKGVSTERDEALGFGMSSVPQAYLDAVVRAARLSDPRANRNDVLRQLKRMHFGELGRSVPLAANLVEDTRHGLPRVSCQLRSWAPGLALRVARALGGGGHSRAAGATFHGTLSEARERVWHVLEEASRREEGPPA